MSDRRPEGQDASWREYAASMPTSLRERWERERDPGERINMIHDALCPPEPQLLDTCVLQNLDWVDRQFVIAGSISWDEAATARLSEKFGEGLANDLIDLGILYKTFEDKSGYPWLVCNAAIDEAEFLSGPNGPRLRNMIDFLIGHQDCWSSDAYPGIAQGLLLVKRRGRVSPLILRALGVATAEEVHGSNGPLGFLPDRGDRLVAAHGLLANIPVVLTTDRKTFWRHRERLADLGLRVMRPAELLPLYNSYWGALEVEFARRRATHN